VQHRQLDVVESAPDRVHTGMRLRMDERSHFPTATHSHCFRSEQTNDLCFAHSHCCKIVGAPQCAGAVATLHTFANHRRRLVAPCRHRSFVHSLLTTTSCAEHSLASRSVTRATCPPQPCITLLARGCLALTGAARRRRCRRLGSVTRRRNASQRRRRRGGLRGRVLPRRGPRRLHVRMHERPRAAG